jgi:hypothetical protein
MKYLFCMKANRCQKVALAICQTGHELEKEKLKDREGSPECKYLRTKEDGEVDCRCPTSLQYLSGLTKLTEEVVNRVKAERKAGYRLDEEEEEPKKPIETIE